VRVVGSGDRDEIGERRCQQGLPVLKGLAAPAARQCTGSIGRWVANGDKFDAAVRGESLCVNRTDVTTSDNGGSKWRTFVL
jgi:hypothetical protein